MVVEVVPDARGWKVLVSGRQEGLVYDTREDAEVIGRVVATALNAELRLLEAEDPA